MRKVIGVRKYKAGYEVRDEEIEAGDKGQVVVMKTAYTPDGHYIGSPKVAHMLCVKRGIKPEPMPSSCPDSSMAAKQVCSIGFCEKDQKWFGWSHRAIYGFKIGDKVKEGDCTATCGVTDEWLKTHPEADISLPIGFEAKTLDDCKIMAIAFSESVS